MLVGVSLALALLGAFLVRKVGKQVSRPVEELTRSAVHAIASDDDVPLSQQQRRDEVGVLARTLEQARQSIRQQMAEIEQMGAARQKLESELSIARDIQRAMLPQGRTIVPRPSAICKRFASASDQLARGKRSPASDARSGQRFSHWAGRLPGRRSSSSSSCTSVSQPCVSAKRIRHPSPSRTIAPRAVQRRPGPKDAVIAKRHCPAPSGTAHIASRPSSLPKAR